MFDIATRIEGELIESFLLKNILTVIFSRHDWVVGKKRRGRGAGGEGEGGRGKREGIVYWEGKGVKGRGERGRGKGEVGKGKRERGRG